MSFDLFFCWERRQRVNFDEVCSWAVASAHFQRHENQLWYSNEDTGVYFSVDFEAELPADGEGPEIPEGYFDTGLSFNLNFNRPSYFGHEAMPIIEDLSKKFGLFAYDPQARDSDHLLLRDVNANDLLEAWLEHNRSAILTMIEHAGCEAPPQMSLRQAMYRWNYSRKKKHLEEKCGNQIFVPSLSPIRRIGSTQVQLAFAYTQDVPCLVPASDWVLVVRKKKAHFWSTAHTDVGVLTAARFNELAAQTQTLRPFDSAELLLQVIPREGSSSFSKVVQTCELEYPREEFEVLAPDGFVDVEIGSQPSPS